MNIALITVRSSSTRLPNKCFLPFGRFNVLGHIINRVRHYNLKPLICTTTNNEDVAIVDIAKKMNVDYFCGSSINKLMRWRDCCRKYDIESFHTVDADDLFFCGEEVHRSLKLLQTGYDMVSPSPSAASGGCTVGFSLLSKTIDKACSIIPEDADTEMMWGFIEKMNDVKIKTLDDPKNAIITDRMTLDYPEDYEMLLKLLSYVGNLGTRYEISDVLHQHPQIAKINSFRNREWKDNQNKKLLEQ